MVKQHHRTLEGLLDSYRDYLVSKVSKIRILGEADERVLTDVFIELSIATQTRRSASDSEAGSDSPSREHYGVALHEIGTRTSSLRKRYIRPRRKDARLVVKPDELLRKGTKAIISGGPGCGKTTLLKYLTVRAQEEANRLVIWLELKDPTLTEAFFAKSEEDAALNNSLILQEMWLNHLKTHLQTLNLTDREIRRLREHWRDRFSKNEIAVFLDGFDEVKSKGVEALLISSINQFATNSNNNSILVSTRPYARFKLGIQHLCELEVSPFDQSQIELFLNRYYPNDPTRATFLANVREQPAFAELLRVPLLLGSAFMLHKDNSFTDQPLKLYEAIVGDLVHALDRAKSVHRQFKIEDERLRFEFLEFLAFERLLRDPLRDEEQEVELVFTYELLERKAQAFLARKRSLHSPRDLANDAIATSLLREVGTEYAFLHLTLQEYLAAVAFAGFYQTNKSEGMRILCTAYHNQSIVDMEVLPMILGASNDADEMYSEIECWPESLSFTNLRLRLRGLTYSARIKKARLSKLSDVLLDFISRYVPDQTPFRGAVAQSCAGVSREIMNLIETKAASLIAADGPYYYQDSFTELLAEIGSRKAIDAIIEAVVTLDSEVCGRAASSLGRIGTDRAIDALIPFLTEKDKGDYSSAAEAIYELAPLRAVPALIFALNDETADSYVRARAAHTLARIGSDAAVEALISALNDTTVRYQVTLALGHLGSERAVETLIKYLSTGDTDTRQCAAEALGWTGSDRAVEALVAALDQPEVRLQAAKSLGWLASEKAVEALSGYLMDKRKSMRYAVAEALSRTGSPELVDTLISALKEGYDYGNIVSALGRVGGEKAVDALILELNGKHSPWDIPEALVWTGSDRAIDALIPILKDTDSRNSILRSRAVKALGYCDSKKADVVSALLFVLKNEEEGFVRSAAVEALVRIASEKASDALILALNDESDDVRWTAVESLTRMKGEALLGGLKRTLNSHNAVAQKRVAAVIGYYCNDAQTLERLEQLAKVSEDDAVRKAAKEAAGKVTRKLERLGYAINDGTAQPLIDNESREQFLIGEVYRIVGEAGHLFSQKVEHDWGIDGEIEFKNDFGLASGQRVYLQLKSGDSYLRKRKRDGKEIFTIKARHASYWQSHAYPVMLVIRDSSGRIRWMNVTEYLQRQGPGIKQIEFQGEPFTAESVKEMRARFAR